MVKCQKRLTEFKGEVAKAKRVKRELKVHLSNLPQPLMSGSTVPEFTPDDLLAALSPDKSEVFPFSQAADTAS